MDKSHFRTFYAPPIGDGNAAIRKTGMAKWPSPFHHAYIIDSKRLPPEREVGRFDWLSDQTNKRPDTYFQD